MIQTALRLAHEAHEGQVDKGGAPYIGHPLRLMRRFQDETRQIVSLLHDVLEDGRGITEDTFRNLGFSEDVISAVKAITRAPGESYMAFIDRCAKNAIAADVKLEDLDDNMDLTRLQSVGKEDLARQAQYRRAKKRLLKERQLA